ncbi:hypothetical protein [Nocardioides sp. SYSU DS0663]|uniref:hypothetical protein n=1 Tax=Nocardioides sp. SYSU DS0663 TaxID=3416445 RepID=UPI003F4CACFD
MSSLASGPAPHQRLARRAEAAVERARLTVVPPRRVRAARVPFVTLVSVLLLGGVVGLLLFNTQMQQASFAATALADQADNLAAREQTLTMEVERLRDPQEIAVRATELGMVVAAAPTFLDLDSGQVTGTRQPAGEEGRLPLHESPPPPPGAAVSAASTAASSTSTAAGTTGPADGRGSSSGDTAGRDGDRGAGDGRTSHESRQSQRSQEPRGGDRSQQGRGDQGRAQQGRAGTTRENPGQDARPNSRQNSR